MKKNTKKIVLLILLTAFFCALIVTGYAHVIKPEYVSKRLASSYQDGKWDGSPKKINKHIYSLYKGEVVYDLQKTDIDGAFRYTGTDIYPDLPERFLLFHQLHSHTKLGSGLVAIVTESSENYGSDSNTAELALFHKGEKVAGIDTGVNGRLYVVGSYVLDLYGQHLEIYYYSGSNLELIEKIDNLLDYKVEEDEIIFSTFEKENFKLATDGLKKTDTHWANFHVEERFNSGNVVECVANDDFTYTLVHHRNGENIIISSGVIDACWNTPLYTTTGIYYVEEDGKVFYYYAGESKPATAYYYATGDSPYYSEINSYTAYGLSSTTDGESAIYMVVVNNSANPNAPSECDGFDEVLYLN